MTFKQINGITRPSQSPSRDPSTLLNYHHFFVNSTDLNFSIDFDNKLVNGNITINATVKSDTDRIVLDTSYLKIHQVFVNDVATKFSVKERRQALGSAFHIYKPCEANESLKLYITFLTTEKCTALQFLDKQATDGGKHPYMFSQSEAIHARSLFPCFDTPSIKSVYTMSVKTPLAAVMSGLKVESDEDNVYKYMQPVPIPSYLVALASGDIHSLPVGPRSRVFCELPKLQKCQNEFNGDVEKFIEAAEKIVFKYEWKEYDILILPNSFPYGGMEVPNVTFATPTIVTGDKSNIDVVAHELAHSWAGNLVTNCSWEHFWLNEGWCVYLERRILGYVHGEPYRQFMAIIGWYDLSNSIKAMGPDGEKYSLLCHDMTDGSDPDDAFSTVPYEKGSTLIMFIENLLTREKFDPFIPFYFNKFKYKSLDSYQFIDSLYEFFTDDHDTLDSIDWETWIFKPGMPPITPKFDTSLADQCYELADKWFKSISTGEFSDFSIGDIKGLNSNQLVVFLETLIAFDKRKDFSWKQHLNVLDAMDEVYGEIYSNETNAEVLSRWYYLQVGGHNEEFYEKIGEFLGTVGRMKFVRPGYVTLNNVDHKMAVEYFKRFETRYHPICQALVKKDLGLD